MKIKSNFRDYYDHVAHMYGGGDPKFVYSRVPIATEHCVVQLTSHQANELNANRIFNYGRSRFDENQYQYKYLVIAGKRYLLVSSLKPNTLIPLEYRLFTEKNFPDAYEKARNVPSWRKVSYDKEIGGEFPVLTDIARTIGAPVYCIEQIRRGDKQIEAVIDQNIPILANYEIPTIISAEQLYQDLSYYVANTMNLSPDLIVNDNQTDKEKIMGHGFDLKKSFRHRK